MNKAELVKILVDADQGAPSTLMKKKKQSDLQAAVDALPGGDAPKPEKAAKKAAKKADKPADRVVDGVTRKDTGKWVRFYDASGYEVGRVRTAEVSQVAALTR